MASQMEPGLITVWVFMAGHLSRIYTFYVCVYELDGDLVVYRGYHHMLSHAKLTIYTLLLRNIQYIRKGSFCIHLCVPVFLQA